MVFAYHCCKNGFRAPEDVEDALFSFREGPHHVQVELHPQLIRGVVCVLRLVVQTPADTQPFWNLKKLFHVGYRMVWHLQELSFVYKVQAQHVDDLCLLVFRSVVRPLRRCNNIVRFRDGVLWLQFPHDLIHLFRPLVLDNPQPDVDLPEFGASVVYELGQEWLVKRGVHCPLE